jgi:hypothetical protein
MKCQIVLIFFLASLMIYVSTKSRGRNLKSRTHGGFLDTCKEIRISTRFLLARCKIPNSEEFEVITNINLNECLGIIDSKLEWKKNGDFSHDVNRCDINVENGDLNCYKTRLVLSMSFLLI